MVTTLGSFHLQSMLQLGHIFLFSSPAVFLLPLCINIPVLYF